MSSATTGVLIVDDEPPARSRLRQLLAGMETTVAGIKRLAESGS